MENASARRRQEQAVGGIGPIRETDVRGVLPTFIPASTFALRWTLDAMHAVSD